MKKIKYEIIVELDLPYERSYHLCLEDGEELLILPYSKRGNYKAEMVPNIIYGIPINKLNAFCEVLNHFKKVALDQCFVGDNRADDYFVSNHVDRQGYNVSVYDISK